MICSFNIRTCVGYSMHSVKSRASCRICVSFGSSGYASVWGFLLVLTFKKSIDNFAQHLNHREITISFV